MYVYVHILFTSRKIVWLQFLVEELIKENVKLLENLLHEMCRNVMYYCLKSQRWMILEQWSRTNTKPQFWTMNNAFEFGALFSIHRWLGAGCYACHRWSVPCQSLTNESERERKWKNVSAYRLYSFIVIFTTRSIFKVSVHPTYVFVVSAFCSTVFNKHASSNEF